VAFPILLKNQANKIGVIGLIDRRQNLSLLGLERLERRHMGALKNPQASRKIVNVPATLANERAFFVTIGIDTTGNRLDETDMVDAFLDSLTHGQILQRG